jgi:hypothetical protein
MATTDDLYPDEVETFAEEWYRFRGLLPKSEREHWDVLVDRARERPYPGHCQLAQVEDDPKWPIVFTMLVTQQAEISRLRAEVEAAQTEVAALRDEVRELRESVRT